jgi:hypothetical protein
MKNTKIALLVILVTTALNISANNGAECTYCNQTRKTTAEANQGVVNTTLNAPSDVWHGFFGGKSRRERKEEEAQEREQNNQPQRSYDRPHPFLNAVTLGGVSRAEKRRQKDENRKLNAQQAARD